MHRIICYFAKKKQTNMITPMTIWVVTAVSVAVVIILSIIVSCRKLAIGKYHNFFEIGSERAEFWIPGDPDINDDDSDCEDFDTL